MPTVDATVSGTSSNSYVTVAEADSYFSDSFGRLVWAPTVADTKSVLVIHASRLLDQYMSWEGLKTEDDQAMEWPRTGTYDKTGALYASDAIPGPVKFAVFELAYHMLISDGLSFVEQSVDRVKVGPIDVEFSKKSTDSGIPSFVESLVAHIGATTLIRNGQMRAVRLERT